MIRRTSPSPRASSASGKWTWATWRSPRRTPPAPSTAWGLALVASTTSCSSRTRTSGSARYLGTVQDVTEQVRGQRDARLNARLLGMASVIAHIGGWTYNTAHGRVIWSDEVCRIHEVPPGTAPTVEEAIAWFTPESRAALRPLVDACLRDGTPYDEELRLVTARGRSVWVRSK